MTVAWSRYLSVADPQLCAALDSFCLIKRTMLDLMFSTPLIYCHSLTLFPLAQSYTDLSPSF